MKTSKQQVERNFIISQLVYKSNNYFKTSGYMTPILPLTSTTLICHKTKPWSFLYTCIFIQVTSNWHQYRVLGQTIVSQIRNEWKNNSAWNITLTRKVKILQTNNKWQGALWTTRSNTAVVSKALPGQH